MEQWHMDNQIETRLQTNAKIILGLGLACLGIWLMQAFLPAIAWALIIAIGTWPLYTKALTRFKNHKGLVAGAFSLTVIMVFLVPLSVFAFHISKELHAILELTTDIRQNGMAVPTIVSKLPFGLADTVTNWWNGNLIDADSINNTLGKLNKDSALLMGRNFSIGLFHKLATFIFTVTVLFFFYLDGDYLGSQILRASKMTLGSHGERATRQLVKSLRGVIDGLVLVGMAEGFTIGIAYVFAGVPHPTILGAITAIGAMVPMGAPLIFIGASIYLFLNGQVVSAIALAVFGMVIATIADHIIRPVLIGNATKLHFMLVLFGVLGGFEIWGLLGLFIGPTIMSAIVFMWREWLVGENKTED
jgi:predicted PurR-regulated permease PerM